MERGLHDRDRVGLQDQVLLENYHSEDAFIDNLKKRFQENLIYVSLSSPIDSICLILLVPTGAILKSEVIDTPRICAIRHHKLFADR